MARRKPRTESDGWAAAGVPAYVKGWCCKAREGTMRQGFRDVGYLFVPHVLTFRPAMISRRVWREQVRVLAREIGNASPSGVRQWFQTHYPLLMALIPRYRRREFAQGVIERATEPDGEHNEIAG